MSVTVAKTTVVTTAYDLHLDEAFRILLQNLISFETNTSLNRPRNSCDNWHLPLLHPVLHLHELSSMIDLGADRFLVNIG